MASVHQNPRSPYWMAKYRDHDNQIVTRTTKQRKRSTAQLIANEWEHAAKAARARELTRATIQNALSFMMERTIGETLDRRSIKQYLVDWLNAGDRSPGTLARYKPIIEGFIKFIGERRAGAAVSSVTSTEIERFRDQQITEGKTPSTANLALKVLRSAFGAARRMGVILSNPADGVALLNESDSEQRVPFEDDQVRALIAVSDNEWRGMILFGYHTGIRLGDAAHLTWRNIDPVAQTLSFRDAKTSRRKRRDKKLTTIYLHSELADYIETLPSGDDPVAPLFPALFGRSSGSHAGLSNEFSRLMVKAKIRPPLGVEKQGSGRRFRALGFHSLRHTLISNLANAAVPSDVRKEIAGHSSDATHARYVHLDLELQRKAISLLPRLHEAEDRQ